MDIWWLYPVSVCFLLSLFLTDVTGLMARRLGLVDRPDGTKKLHRGPVALGGGIPIFLSFGLVTAGVLFLTDHFTSGEITLWHFVGFLLGGLVLVLGGLVDDVVELPPRSSFLFPLIAALIVVMSGIGVEKVTNPFGGAIEIGTWTSSVITFVWVLGMIYTTKLLDGMDGLATGISAIGALMIVFLALSVAYFQPDVALLSLLALAALLGFLFWNFFPAHIFLGEGGSTLVGYMLAVLAVISGSKFATALLVVGIPVLDVAFVLFARWRSGHSLVHGDRSHLHHQLRHSGFSERQIVAMYYVIALSFGLVTLLFTNWLKVVALSLLVVVMFLTTRFLPKK